MSYLSAPTFLSIASLGIFALTLSCGSSVPGTNPSGSSSNLPSLSGTSWGGSFHQKMGQQLTTGVSSIVKFKNSQDFELFLKDDAARTAKGSYKLSTQSSAVLFDISESNIEQFGSKGSVRGFSYQMSADELNLNGKDSTFALKRDGDPASASKEKSNESDMDVQGLSVEGAWRCQSKQDVWTFDIAKSNELMGRVLTESSVNGSFQGTIRRSKDPSNSGRIIAEFDIQSASDKRLLFYTVSFVVQKKETPILKLQKIESKDSSSVDELLLLNCKSI